MSTDSRCAECLVQVAPAVERRFALALWRAVHGDALRRAQTGQPLSASGVILTLRAELEARTGLNLSEVGG